MDNINLDHGRHIINTDKIGSLLERFLKVNLERIKHKQTVLQKRHFMKKICNCIL